MLSIDKTEDIVDAEIVEDITVDQPVERNKVEKFMDQLRKLADWREAHQTDWGHVLFPSYFGNGLSIHARDASAAADAVKAIGGSWSKRITTDDQYMIFSGKVVGEKVEVWVSREQVCTPKVVGKKTVQKPKKVEYETVEVDDIEYECGSLMSAAAKLDLAKLEEIAQ